MVDKTFKYLPLSKSKHSLDLFTNDKIPVKTCLYSNQAVDTQTLGLERKRTHNLSVNCVVVNGVMVNEVNVGLRTFHDVRHIVNLKVEQNASIKPF